jgi:hypothetical protein
MMVVWYVLSVCLSKRWKKDATQRDKLIYMRGKKREKKKTVVYDMVSFRKKKNGVVKLS